MQPSTKTGIESCPHVIIMKICRILYNLNDVRALRLTCKHLYQKIKYRELYLEWMPLPSVLQTEDHALACMAFGHYGATRFWRTIAHMSGYNEIRMFNQCPRLSPEFEEWVVLTFPSEELSRADNYRAIARMPTHMIRKIALDLGSSRSATMGGHAVVLHSEHINILSALAVMNRWQACKGLLDEGIIHYANLSASSSDCIRVARNHMHERFARAAERYRREQISKRKKRPNPRLHDTSAGD